MSQPPTRDPKMAQKSFGDVAPKFCTGWPGSVSAIGRVREQLPEETKA
jgi:hypothetical protein